MLNLPLLKQTEVKETADRYEITVAGAGSLPECKCGAGHLVRNGTKTAYYVDTPMHGKQVSVTLQRQRFSVIDQMAARAPTTQAMPLSTRDTTTKTARPRPRVKSPPASQ